MQAMGTVQLTHSNRMRAPAAFNCWRAAPTPMHGTRKLSPFQTLTHHYYAWVASYSTFPSVVRVRWCSSELISRPCLLSNQGHRLKPPRATPAVGVSSFLRVDCGSSPLRPHVLSLVCFFAQAVGGMSEWKKKKTRVNVRLISSR